jgi:hypothetical protein
MSVYTLLPNEFVPRFYLGSMPKITPVAEEVIDKAVLENYTDDTIHELQYKITDSVADPSQVLGINEPKL